MGRCLKDHSPLTGMEETPSLEMIASALSLLVEDVVGNFEVRGVIHGFFRKLLESKAWSLEKVKNWKASNTSRPCSFMELSYSQISMISYNSQSSTFS